MGLDWMVVAVEASSFAAAPSAPSDRAWRLPTQTELVEAIANNTFTFGVAAAVWTESGIRVDPTSEAIILEAGDDSATAIFVFTTEKAFTRPPAPTKQRLTVLGYLDEATFQMCVEAAQHLNTEYKDEYAITVERMMGFEFERRRDAIAVTAGDSVKNLRVLVHNQDTGAVQSGDAFIERVTATTSFRTFDLPVTDPQSYQSLARVALRKHLASTGSTFVWLLVKIDDMVIGRIVFQLFSNICPKTCLNFQHLCRGDLPDIKVGNTVTKLSYKGSTFYRVVKNGWIQAGDIAGNKTGNSGMSIYGRHFPDESFDVAHDDAGTLGMANDGEHTNSSSFYITLKKSKWMDGRYVAFGRVVEGLHVVQAIHNSEVKPNQTPVKKITIDDCGDVSLDG